MYVCMYVYTVEAEVSYGGIAPPREPHTQPQASAHRSSCNTQQHRKCVLQLFWRTATAATLSCCSAAISTMLSSWPLGIQVFETGFVYSSMRASVCTVIIRVFVAFCSLAY